MKLTKVVLPLTITCALLAAPLAASATGDSDTVAPVADESISADERMRLQTIENVVKTHSKVNRKFRR